MIETLTIPDSFLNQLDDVRRRPDSNVVDALVPLDLIADDDVPIDDIHVEDLIKAFNDREEEGDPQGQRVPILLAYLDGYELALIEDGFHRRKALQRRKKSHAIAAIAPEPSLEIVHRERIRLALTHEVVAFPRLYKWTIDMFDETKWRQEFGLNLGQAFQIATSKRKTLPNGFPQQETESLTAWFNESCEIWKKSPAEVRAELHKAYGVDPKIVEAVRDRISTDGMIALTTAHIREISLSLPFNYEYQRILVGAILARSLSIKETREICIAVEYAKDMEEANKIITQKLVDFKELREARESVKTGVSAPTPHWVRTQVYTPPTNQVSSEETAEINYFEKKRVESTIRGIPISELVIEDAYKYANVRLIRDDLLIDEVQQGYDITVETLVGALTLSPLEGKFTSPLNTRSGKEKLTPTEAKILALLASDPQRVFTHESLLRRIWGPEYVNENHLLRVNIARLRAKLGDNSEGLIIENSPGVGYKIATSSVTVIEN